MSANEKVILHLIKQDLLYHRMIYGLQKYEVHVEFYPDFISAILMIMGVHSEKQAETLTDQYTEMMGSASREMSDSSDRLDTLAKACFDRLSGEKLGEQ